MEKVQKDNPEKIVNYEPGIFVQFCPVMLKVSNESIVDEDEDKGRVQFKKTGYLMTSSKFHISPPCSNSDKSQLPMGPSLLEEIVTNSCLKRFQSLVLNEYQQHIYF